MYRCVWENACEHGSVYISIGCVKVCICVRTCICVICVLAEQCPAFPGQHTGVRGQVYSFWDHMVVVGGQTETTDSGGGAGGLSVE